MRVSDGVWTKAIARAQGLGHRPGLVASGHLKPEPTEEVRRRGRAALALLNDDDEAA